MWEYVPAGGEDGSLQASGRYPPNRRLTWFRLQRGWSYDELAAQLKASMRAHGEIDTGLIGNTIRRWETGERWPEPRFRKHLVLVFDQPATELGLLTSDELALRPAESQDDELDLLRTFINMASGPKGDHRVSRQAFLRALLGAGLLGEIAPLTVLLNSSASLARASDRTSRLDQNTVSAHASITTTQQRLYWSTPAQPLFESSFTHAQLGVQLLRDSLSAPLRKQLAASTAHAALLSARLAFFDLGQVAVAERWLDIARCLAQEAEEHPLTAAVYGHMAFIPGFAGNQPAAMAVLDTAYRHASYAAAPRLRSWLSCVDAEVLTRTGDARRALSRIRQAEDALVAEGNDPDWLDFYDPSRLAGFAGYALLAAGKHAQASTALERALATLAPTAVKQRSVLLLDLATAVAPLEARHAVDLAGEALDTLQQDAYAIAHDRIGVVRAALRDSRYVAELDARTAPAI